MYALFLSCILIFLQTREEFILILQPIIVDIDGTLIRKDMLHESALKVLFNNPFEIFRIIYNLSKRKAANKQFLSDRSIFDPSILPYNNDLLTWLKQQKDQGRKLILCTASDLTIANKISNFFGIFNEVIASEGITNLAGKHKAEALEKRFGRSGFDYLGNSQADIVIWQSARRAIVVNASSSMTKKVEANCEVDQVFPSLILGPLASLKVLRVHQWPW